MVKARCGVDSWRPNSYLAKMRFVLSLACKTFVLWPLASPCWCSFLSPQEVSPCHRPPLTVKLTVATTIKSEERTTSPGHSCCSLLLLGGRDAHPLPISCSRVLMEDWHTKIIRAVKMLGAECRSADNTDSILGPPSCFPLSHTDGATLGN